MTVKENNPLNSSKENGYSPTKEEIEDLYTKAFEIGKHKRSKERFVFVIRDGFADRRYVQITPGCKESRRILVGGLNNVPYRWLRIYLPLDDKQEFKLSRAFGHSRCFLRFYTPTSRLNADDNSYQEYCFNFDTFGRIQDETSFGGYKSSADLDHFKMAQSAINYLHGRLKK